jgi:hypothetical protein
LPHWQQSGAVYFVTFRLADAVPHNLRTQWESEREGWLRVHPKPWSAEIECQYHDRFSGAIERWLDAGYGSCILRQPNCADIVNQTLRYFDGQRLVMISLVVMPNHAHALFVQNAEWPLERSCGAGKALRHEKSTRCSIVRGVFGNGIILIGWFGMKDISRIAYDISAGILQRRACTMESTFCTKPHSHEASSRQEAPFFPSAD